MRYKVCSDVHVGIKKCRWEQNRRGLELARAYRWGTEHVRADRCGVKESRWELTGGIEQVGPFGRDIEKVGTTMG